MAGQVTTKVFKGGMNKDIDVSLLPEDQYTHAENYKLVAKDGSNNFILETAEGNAIWFDFTAQTGLSTLYMLAGYAFINPYLVLFYTTHDEDASPPASGNNAIVRVLTDGDEIVETKVIYHDGSGGTNGGNLTLSLTYPISAIGYYEAPDNIKVYWTDGYNPVRTINIMDPNSTTYSAGMLDIIPDFPLSSSVQVRPQIGANLKAGHMKACSVQYAYQYYLEHGVQTLWSPVSALQIIPRKSGGQTSGITIDLNNFDNTEGGDVGEDTGFGVEVQVNIPSENLYTHMRVVAIQFNEYEAVPQIRIIKEYALNTQTSYTLSLVDVGDLIGEMTYDEFAISSNAVYRAKALAVKDNRLFLGNIHEYFYDVENFDCRAYRHDDGNPSAGTGGRALIYKEDNSVSYNVDDDDPTRDSYTDVPEDFDCVNLFNKVGNEYGSREFVYQADLDINDEPVLGATGPNVEIGFTYRDVIIDQAGTSATSTNTANTSVTGANSTILDAGYRSFQRQEVYRIGIVFRNNKMQSSPVKWVCDLKMPCYTEDGRWSENTVFYHTYLGGTFGNVTYARHLGLEVTMSNFDTIDAATWEVVYVPRSSDDRSVLGQGILQPTVYLDDASRPVYKMDTENPVEGDSYLPAAFISPEVAYNKNLSYSSLDFVHKIGYFTYADDPNECDADANYDFFYYKVNNFVPDDGWYTEVYKQILDDGRMVPYVGNKTTSHSIDGSPYNPYNSDAPGNITGHSGTHFALHPDVLPVLGDWADEVIDSTASGSTKVAVVNYRRNAWSYQYGGPSYLARQYNEYIGASDSTQTNGTVEVWEGDTYIDFFWFLKQSMDMEDTLTDDTVGSTFLFPAESSISPRLSPSPYFYRTGQLALANKLLQEVAGTWTGDVNNTEYTYVQDLPLYIYNPVYSQLQKANIFFADSVDFDVSSKYPTRILNSELKINNEGLDSFTIFKPNNFLDLDGAKGQIYNLMNFKNSLFYWQEGGFGIASVNRQALIQDNNPGVLALGTGGILDRYDYISDTVGNQNQFGIAASRVGLYWFDNNKREFFSYSGETQSLSKVKGIQTWVNSLDLVGNVQAIFDYKYNDIIFTLTEAREGTVLTVSGDNVATFAMTETDGYFTSGDVTVRSPGSSEYRQDRHVVTRTGAFTYTIDPTIRGDVGGKFYVTYDKDGENDKMHTIVYNEMIGKFVSYASFAPRAYIKTDAGYMSTPDLKDIWRHNDSSVSRATFYSTTYDSVITTSFNENFPYTKVWDTLKWVSESVDSNGVNQFKDTFDTVELYNDYQHTGDRSLYFQHDTPPGSRPTPIARRERTWSMSIPRNLVDTNVSSNPDITDLFNWDENALYKERMRDKYITASFTYDNTSGNTFSVPFVSAIYRKSVR